MSGYAELAVTSNFSFLRGASHPEELVMQAHRLGLAGIGIADRNSVAGVVRVHMAAAHLNEQITASNEKLGTNAPLFKIAVGARLVFADGTPDILAYPQDRAGWGRLTRLLSLGKRRAEKGDCMLGLPDLLEFIVGLNLIVMPPPRVDGGAMHVLLARLKAAACDNSLWLAASLRYRGDDARRLARLADLADTAMVPLVAVNDVLYHAARRRALQDILTCIREHTTIDQAGRRLEANAERHLKPAHEMARLFRKASAAIGHTLDVLAACHFSLEELRGTEYPDETRAGFATPQDALVAFAQEGLQRRYRGAPPAAVRHALQEELRVIGELGYAPFFLTVDEIVKFARELEIPILCQGRGSAANSVICYCLGITDVNPASIDLLFERFVSAERREPPDTDVDFEHERREEVIQHIYEKYGRERAGLAATVICYRGRSAIREVGKVFGLSQDTVGALASTLWGWSMEGVTAKHTRRAGLDPADRRLKMVRSFARLMRGFPRHLSQHVGGFVITRSRLDEVVPIENAAMEKRTVIEWEKNDLEALGLLKVDVLGLGMLSCLRRAFDFMRDHYNVARDLSIQDEDAATYNMIKRADTVGVFQIESRAQMSMLPRLRPEKFYDLVIEVAIVRPGPIQGDMVHPYLQRRERLRTTGQEPDYPAPGNGDRNELKEVLKKTLGVPLFQEQAMRIAIVAAGFKPEEADRLRRAMATFKRVGTIDSFRAKFINGMTGRGYDLAFAARCFSQIEGFGEYGFPESHAASFANLVYASAWIKCRYPDVFAAALINSQPMGFYAPAQIVRDAQEHGVEVRPVDINFSDWDCTLELIQDSSAQFIDASSPLKRWGMYTSRLIGCGAATPPSPRRGEGWDEGSSDLSIGPHPLTPTLSPPGRGSPSGIADRHLAAVDRLATQPAHIGMGPRVRGDDSRGNGGDKPQQARPQLHPRHAAMANDIRTARALRLGFRQISGFSEDDGKAIAAARGAGFDSVRDLWLRTRLAPSALERLAEADAFRSLGLDRRAALWAVGALRRAGDKDDLPLFARVAMPELEGDAALPPMPLGEHVIADYRHLRLSLKAHPVSFLRAELAARGCLAHERLPTMVSGARVTVAGLVLVRQRPDTASGVIFMTLEDETGIANTIVWPRTFERFRPIVLGARLIGVTGELQNESGVIHIVAERMEDLSPLLRRLSEDAGFVEATARADEVKRPPPERHPRAGDALVRALRERPIVVEDFTRDDDVAAAMPKGRNFH